MNNWKTFIFLATPLQDELLKIIFKWVHKKFSSTLERSFLGSLRRSQRPWPPTNFQQILEIHDYNLHIPLVF